MDSEETEQEVVLLVQLEQDAKLAMHMLKFQPNALLMQQILAYINLVQKAQLHLLT